jgi:hypothetical protein
LYKEKKRDLGLFCRTKPNSTKLGTQDGLMAEWFCSYLRVLFFSEGRLKELFLFGPRFGFRIIREFVVGLCCLIGAGAQEV